MKIKLAEDVITESDVQKLTSWLSSTNHYTKGKETVAFEQEWSKWQGTKYSVFVNSGSSANLLIFLSLLYSGKLRNKKVVVPSVSWVTSVSPAIQLGFEPLLCDCNLDDLGFSVDDFEHLCKTHKPSAAMMVHVLGHSNKMKEILEICEKYDVILIEDACEAPGSKYAGQKLGTFGLASSFSFFYGHQMSTIEGGMVSTNDRDFYNVMLSIRSHGWLRDNEEYFRQRFLEKYNVSDFESQYFFVFPGLNIRSTDLNAFFERKQILKMDSYVAARSENYNKYYNKLKDKMWVQKSECQPVSSMGFSIISENRNKIVASLTAAGVECRPLICGSIQEHPFWNERYQKRDLPNASLVHKSGFYVPCHQGMSDREIDFICNLVRSECEDE